MLNSLRRFGGGSHGGATIGFGYAAAGKTKEALAVASELQKFTPTPYPIAYWTAMIYANLEESDEACTWLETAYTDRGAQMVYLNIDRRFDKLRPDPRFRTWCGA